MSINLRIVSETATTITVEWDPPQGQQLVRTTRPDGTQYVKWDPTLRRRTFAKKQEGSYLVDVLGLIDSGSVDWPIDTPPPPPTGFGAKLRAAFPPLPAPQKTVENRVLGNTSEDGSDVLYRNNEHTVSGSGHGMLVHGGAKRVVIEGARIHDAPGQSKTEGHDGSRQGIATYAADGVPEDLRVIGGEIWDIGGQKYSHGLYFAAVKRGLVQSHLAHDIGDFVHQWYPGESGVDSTATAVNVTVGWPRVSGGYAVVVWAEQGTWEGAYYNSIIWADVMLRGDAELRLHNCIVPPQFSIDSGVILDNVLRIDPKLDAQRRPTAPDAFALADTDWMPALDYKRTPHTRAVVGSVAA